MKEFESPPDFARLLDHLRDTRGFDFSAYKPATLSRRVEKRMGEVGIQSYGDYIDYLEVHPDEFSALFNTILINVTGFFRDTEVFAQLRDVVLPAIVGTKQDGDPIRVWVAGCASGEEAYSIAILLNDRLGGKAMRDRVKIYATDLDEDALSLARQAAYTDKQIESVPPEIRQKYFDQVDATWVVKKEHRRQVIFGRHDLLDDAPIARVDLLTCRNTLMYFNHDAQSKIVSRFHFALRDGGYLLLGKAEMLTNFAAAFDVVDMKSRLFRKIAGTNVVFERLNNYAGREDRAVQTSMANRLREIAFDQDPIAHMVVDARGIVIMANTGARELFRLTARDVGRPLQDLAMSYRPVELRSGIDEAQAKRQTVQIRDVGWPGADGGERYFNVQLTPILDGVDAPLGTKILFVDVTRQHELQEEVHRKRRDLETAYELLQSTNEELETTNEELQSTIEELETTNEELHSTNEELETLNEELQSANEELEAVNNELRKRGVDLSRTNVFLGGILRSVPFGIAVMDDDLQVELWNDVAADMWGVRQDEVRGKHFLGLDIGLPLQELREPLLALRRAPDKTTEMIVTAINRRGREIQVRVVCANVGTADEGHALIVLMQEAAAAPTVH
jgi:two-component system CheB/CheR fusion protein